VVGITGRIKRGRSDRRGSRQVRRTLSGDISKKIDLDEIESKFAVTL
jgi:hypothetical protein